VDSKLDGGVAHPVGRAADHTTIKVHAEKKAALDVVKHRLEEVGLGHLAIVLQHDVPKGVV
jgi:hypothetical protein